MDFSAHLKAISQSIGCQYTVKGEAISMDQVFSLTGLLPALMRRADQLCSFCMGYGLGLSFENVEAAKLGVTVRFDNNTPLVLRLLCVTDVLYEFINRAPSVNSVPLDDLMSD